MTEKWIADAQHEQEEHIRRSTACQGRVGQAHAFRRSGNPRTGEPFSACVVCGVTETREDYAKRMAR